MQSTLQQSSLPSFFFETAPVSQDQRDSIPFEFILRAAPGLEGAQPDGEPFREYLQSGAGSVAVAVFDNLHR